MNRTDHTFVVCAYQESAYLEECILSLKAQSVLSEIIVVTSTPNQLICGMAERYHIPLYINEGESGITQDWNFALSKTESRYVTIAHQDDIYEPGYTERILGRLQECKNPLIAFSDYQELRNGERVRDTGLLRIKRLMLSPLRLRCFQNNRFVRRRILSLGDPICCPAVTFCMDNMPVPLFHHGFRSCEDWEAWEMLSRRRGAFVYIAEPLMCHRIHRESATTEILADHARIDENFQMYCKFWPKWIAGILNRQYTKSEKSNELQK